MNEHDVYGSSKAEQAVNYELSAALRPTRGKDSVLGIQGLCQVAHDANHGAHDTKAGCYHKLDLNVAEDLTMPPMLYVVCWPDERIDEVHEVVDDNPKYQA